MSVKKPLKKPEKSLDELLVGKVREETDGGEKVRVGGREGVRGRGCEGERV